MARSGHITHPARFFPQWERCIRAGSVPPAANPTQTPGGAGRSIAHDAAGVRVVCRPRPDPGPQRYSNLIAPHVDCRVGTGGNVAAWRTAWVKVTFGEPSRMSASRSNSSQLPTRLIVM